MLLAAKSNSYFNRIELIKSKIAPTTKISNLFQFKQEKKQLEIPPKVRKKKFQELAFKTTVKINTNSSSGSGVIIGQQNNQYLVITNAHVIRNETTAKVQTSDGVIHQASPLSGATNSYYDLSILEFNSSEAYEIAIFSTVPRPKALNILATGYSSKTNSFVTKKGKINQYPDRPLVEGYQIGYTSDVVQGMSGGAIFDTISGQLIGINGKGKFPITNTGLIYQDGSKPSPQTIMKMRQLSWGIPITTFFDQVDTNILTKYMLF